MSSEEHEAKREAEFREVNERESAISNNDLWQAYVCECGDGNCDATVELTPEEYERVRQNPTHFLIVPDQEHVHRDIERIVAKHTRFWVVEKLGTAAEVAKDRDPRS
jgi:hypothetical protein